MGCPPDPVEVSISRSGERIAALEERYHSLIDEYAEARRIASLTIGALVAKHTLPHKEKFTIRTDVVPTEMEPYADDSAQYDMERGYEKKVKTLENQLCELRTQLINHGGENTIAPQRTLHLAHRNDDRRVWLAWLKARIELLEFHVMDKATSPESRVDTDKARSMAAEIISEIKRLENIDDETLLRDRSVLGVDEDRWRTPYLD